VSRRFASAMVLLAVLAPPAAHAQVNIDQGNAAAQIYNSDCAACHNSMRGLANGRSASALTSFLTEHYTSSAKEASALAAYVLAGGGGIGTPTPTLGGAGEWITREDNGEHVCKLTDNLYSAAVFHLSSSCEWVIPQPEFGVAVDPSWFRCGGQWQGCKIHFEDGWRPR